MVGALLTHLSAPEEVILVSLGQSRTVLGGRIAAQDCVGNFLPQKGLPSTSPGENVTPHLAVHPIAVAAFLSRCTCCK